MKKITRLPREKRFVQEVAEQAEKLQCANCKYVFANYLTRCPECGSEEWTGYTEINPYTRLPLESFLKGCGHIFWLGGTLLCIYFFWNTDTDDNELNQMFILMGLLSLGLGVLLSSLYFGLSEIIHRILRLQRRLRAFHENHLNPRPSDYNKTTSKKRRTLIQYGTVKRRK